jgi:hypothetical protein
MEMNVSQSEVCDQRVDVKAKSCYGYYETWGSGWIRIINLLVDADDENPEHSAHYLTPDPLAAGHWTAYSHQDYDYDVWINNQVKILINKRLHTLITTGLFRLWRLADFCTWKGDSLYSLSMSPSHMSLSSPFCVNACIICASTCWFRWLDSMWLKVMQVWHVSHFDPLVVHPHDDDEDGHWWSRYTVTCCASSSDWLHAREKGSTHTHTRGSPINTFCGRMKQKGFSEKE